MRAWGRIVLSLVCLLTVATVFGFALARKPNSTGPLPWWNWPGVVLLFATPVWLLTIPFAVLLKDVEGRRGVITFLAGNLLAPVAYLLLILVEGGRPTLNGDGSFFLFFLIVSLPTTFLYGILLSLLNRFFCKQEVSLSLFQET